MIKVKKFTVNPLQENSFLLYDEAGNGMIIDAGFYYPRENEDISLYIAQNNLTLISLVNTHCHFDHVMGVENLRNKYNVPFICHEGDSFWLSRVSAQSAFFGIEMENLLPADRYISEGEILRLGNSELSVLHVPGHSPGHIVLFASNERFLLAGDVLFSGSIGRTDLPGGNFKQLIQGIHEKLMTLPPDTVVYSGHGTETTIGYEKANNPFLNKNGR